MTPPPTIFALASGNLPSAVAIIRISGSEAATILVSMTHRPLPPLRRLVRRDLFDSEDQLLDQAMVVLFCSPRSATGEDMVELHVHGSYAVVDAIAGALSRAGAQPAGPGEFTRRAFAAGKLDLARVEALGDLIAAETDGQRRAALTRTGSRLANVAEAWRTRLVGARGDIEATLDFAEEDQVPATLSVSARADLEMLADELGRAADDALRGRMIHRGVGVVIIGPVNAGKSTLLNALAGSEVAITAPQAGTTRDVVEARIVLGGQLVIVADTAGQRDTIDAVEREGIRRGAERAAYADIIIDLGPNAASTSIAVAAQCDRGDVAAGWRDGVLHLSAVTGAGMTLLEEELSARVVGLARPAQPPLFASERQRQAVSVARDAVCAALSTTDAVIAAEELRVATCALEQVVGRVSPDNILDEVFARFCIGK